MKLGLLNPRSICNKTVEILELLSDFDIDICCLTETYLKKLDKAKFAEMKELGYSIHNKPRAGTGGGVAILFKNGLSLTPQKVRSYPTFEHTESTIRGSSGSLLRISCVYRSGTDTSQSSNMKKFLEDFEDYIISLIGKPGKPIILGDFNIHVENDQCTKALRFLSLIESHGWIQHVSGVTHQAGGTLDLVMTRKLIDEDHIQICNQHICPTGTKADYYLVSFFITTKFHN